MKRKEIWVQKGIQSGKEYVIVAVVQRGPSDKTFNTTIKEIIYQKDYDYIKAGSVISLDEYDLEKSKSEIIHFMFEEI